ncbi:type II secretion system protein [Luteolibacter sp. LG18]|uniref:type II secretion system protein n=1 Tax=Luteolibacter sp. LG18 TaxID=2819286 RepID=UPI002B2DF2D9|nr:hypothetical protein llg_29460 [Luteolibacter sp. LG18]
MRSRRPVRFATSGFTLLELTMVLCILMALTFTGLFFNNKIKDWQLGRTASETLRTVYSAQRMYLADNPTATLASLTNAKLIPYLPNAATTMPTVTSLTGANLTIAVTVSPPKINNGSGGYYDPSASTTDLLWDTGP